MILRSLEILIFARQASPEGFRSLTRHNLSPILYVSSYLLIRGFG